MSSIQLTPKAHKRLSAFVGEMAGIQLPAHKKNLIESRLRKRVVSQDFNNFDDYVEFFLSDDKGAKTEQSIVIDLLTTNKTDFYREARQFEFLSEFYSNSANRLLLKRKPLNVWCAAASTGEEPYTLALELSELARVHSDFSFRILATDISPTVLATARRGVYPESRIATVPLELRKRYFLRSKDTSKALVKMSKPLRNSIQFDEFNLIQGDYSALSKFDVIFCRNVMIYFSPDDRQKVIANLRQRLNPNGLLFVGHAESIGHNRLDFQQLIPTVYQVK